MNPRQMLGRGFFGAETERWGASSLPLSSAESAVLPGLEAPGERAPEVAGEETQLIARARTGDQDAFGVLVRHHQHAIYNLALRMLGDRDEASEATQEVFLSAWQGLRRFRGDARFATWLYRIAYNYCLKVTESRRRDSAARAELAAETAREHTPEWQITAEHALDAERELRETVRVEIANLPPKYRAVLVLRHLQDFSYEEMAEIMRQPIGTVKTQLFRARALLKERLEDLSRASSESITRAGGFSAELGASLRHFLERRREQPLQEGDL